nr:hypothetical protein Iba_chr14eCG0780 [Ipomoea batatas]
MDAGAGEAAETGDNSASAAEERDGPGVATGAAGTGAAGGSAAECGDGAAAKQTATEKAANSATKNNTTSLEDAIDDGRKGIELIKIVAYGELWTETYESGTLGTFLMSVLVGLCISSLKFKPYMCPILARFVSSVMPSILQIVGPEFVAQTDSSSFVATKVNQNAPASSLDLLHCKCQLVPTITSCGTKYVSRKAL